MSDSFTRKLCSGAIAGMIGTAVIYPLDVLKTRIQSGKKGFGLYRGLPATLMGIAPEKAIKLATNDYMRSILGPDTVINRIMAGATAGICQVVVTCPMEAIKIHMQVSKANFIRVISNLGLRKVYRGLGATILRDVPFSMIFFPVSGFLMEKSSPFVGGVVGGCVAAALVTPMDVIKTRLQLDPNQTIMSCFRALRLEGPEAFFKGIVPRCLIVSPLFGISLFFYEIQKKF